MAKRSQLDDSGWPEQWARVKRWHARAERVRRDPPAKGDPGEPEALDDVLAFFTNCYHLADWLKNDRADSHPEAINFVHNDPDLLICRDLANGTKHCILEAKRKPTYINATTTASVSWPTPTERVVRWVVEVTRGDRRDMFEIAERCVAAWRGFIGGLPKTVTVARNAST